MEGGRKARWLEGVLVVAQARRGDCVLGEEERGGDGLLQLLAWVGWGFQRRGRAVQWVVPTAQGECARRM